MAVYVDNVRIAWRGRHWCHLVADNLDELHVFAKKLGLKREWFQDSASYPHYDVTIESREKAIFLGAMKGSRVQIIGCAKKLKKQLEKEKLIIAPEQFALFA